MPNFSLTRSIYGRKLADIRLIQARKLDYTDTYTRLENGWKALYIRGGSSMLRSRLLMSEYRFLALPQIPQPMTSPLGNFVYGISN